MSARPFVIQADTLLTWVCSRDRMGWARGRGRGRGGGGRGGDAPVAERVTLCGRRDTQHALRWEQRTLGGEACVGPGTLHGPDIAGSLRRARSRGTVAAGQGARLIVDGDAVIANIFYLTIPGPQNGALFWYVSSALPAYLLSPSSPPPHNSSPHLVNFRTD